MLLHAAHESRIKRIADVLDHHGDGVGFLNAQVPGRDVGNVAEFLSGGEHPLPGFGWHREPGLVVQNLRNRRTRNPRELPDILLFGDT